MSIKYFFIILLLLALLPPGGGAGPDPARDSAVILVIPSRPRVLQIFFDLAQARELTLVAYRQGPPAAAPVIHVWTGREWNKVGFDDFCALRFGKRPPETVILVGDDRTVPEALRQGLGRPGKTIRLQSLEICDLVNGLDKYFHFDEREWSLITGQYGVKRAEPAGPRPAPAPAAPAGGRKQVIASAPVARDIKPAPAGPERKFSLNLAEDLQIPFGWIEPLALWVGRYEITNAQYERFNRAHDPKKYYDHIIDLPDQPAVFVSWEDANNYCGWLNRNYAARLPAGCECRLPTEKEWMAFAACGRERTYPWGDNWPPPAAMNYKGTEGASLFYNIVHNERFIRNHEDGFIVTAPVGKSGTNDWGLCGVGGNAWEWCRDWYDDAKTTRVLKGAAWNNYEPWILAITNRSDAAPEKSNAMIGFRVVIAPRGK